MLDTSTILPYTRHMQLLDNGTYFCDECQFVFGLEFVDSHEDFDGYHAKLHGIVITNIPDNFKDISNGE